MPGDVAMDISEDESVENGGTREAEVIDDIPDVDTEETETNIAKIDDLNGAPFNSFSQAYEALIDRALLASLRLDQLEKPSKTPKLEYTKGQIMSVSREDM